MKKTTVGGSNGGGGSGGGSGSGAKTVHAVAPTSSVALDKTKRPARHIGGKSLLEGELSLYLTDRYVMRKLYRKSNGTPNVWLAAREVSQLVTGKLRATIQAHVKEVLPPSAGQTKPPFVRYAMMCLKTLGAPLREPPLVEIKGLPEDAFNHPLMLPKDRRTNDMKPVKGDPVNGKPLATTYWALTEAGKTWAAENCAGALGMKKKPLTKSKSKKEGGSGGSVMGGGRGPNNNGVAGSNAGASGSGRTYNFREVRGKKRKYEEDDDDDEDEDDEMEEREDEDEDESDAHAHSPSLFRGFVTEYSSDSSQDSESDGEREHEDNQLEWDEPSHSSSSSSSATLEKEMDRMRRTHELLIQQFEQTQLQFTEALDEKNRLEKNHRELQVLYSILQEEVKKLNSQVSIFTSTSNPLPLPLQTLVQSPPAGSSPPLALSVLAAHSTAPSSSNSTLPPPVRQAADLLAFSKATTPSGPLRPTLYATNIIGALKAMIEIESKAATTDKVPEEDQHELSRVLHSLDDCMKTLTPAPPTIPIAPTITPPNLLPSIVANAAQ